VRWCESCLGFVRLDTRDFVLVITENSDKRRDHGRRGQNVITDWEASDIRQLSKYDPRFTKHDK